MAVRTAYLLDSLQAGSAHLATQLDGTAPTVANMTTGWVPGVTAATTPYRAMDSQAKPSTGWTATVLPAAATVPDNTAGDSWVLGPFNGSFVSGNWTFTFGMIGVTRVGDTGTGAVAFRVMRGTNVTGAGSTEVTTAQQVSSTGNVMGATVSVTATWAAPAMTLSNEYLFVEVAFKIVAAGQNSTTDTVFRAGTSQIATTNFSPFFGRQLLVRQAVNRAGSF